MTLGLAVTFKNFQHFSSFKVFFYHKQFNRHKLSCSLKCVLYALYTLLFSISHYPCFVINYTLTNLSNKILIFHDCPGPKNEIL